MPYTQSISSPSVTYRLLELHRLVAVGRGHLPAERDERGVVVGIDDAGRRARDRLRASEPQAAIGHCDWLAGNLRWSGDALLVDDRDSMTADSEAVLVGFAAALYSTVSADELATVEDTERFLVAYCHARGREFSAGELGGRGRLASGPEPTTPSISTRSGSPSPHCPRVRPASASVVLGPARGGHKIASCGTPRRGPGGAGCLGGIETCSPSTASCWVMAGRCTCSPA